MNKIWKPLGSWATGKPVAVRDREDWARSVVENEHGGLTSGEDCRYVHPDGVVVIWGLAEEREGEKVETAGEECVCDWSGAEYQQNGCTCDARDTEVLDVQRWDWVADCPECGTAMWIETRMHPDASHPHFARRYCDACRPVQRRHYLKRGKTPLDYMRSAQLMALQAVEYRARHEAASYETQENGFLTSWRVTPLRDRAQLFGLLHQHSRTGEWLLWHACGSALECQREVARYLPMLGKKDKREGRVLNALRAYAREIATPDIALEGSISVKGDEISFEIA